MADAPLSTNIEYFNDPAKGQPIALGKVYIGQPDTDPEILANRVSVTLIQEDGTRVVKAPASQPFTTGAGGNILDGGDAVVILVDGTYSLKVLDSLLVQKIYVPFANEVADEAADEGILILNGSFENETQFSGIPDNWTLAPGTNGTIEIDSADQAHGLNSLKFTGTDATGGGTATSDRFNVLENGNLDIRFSYVSSAVDTLNKVEIKYYDASGSAITITTVYTEGAANPVVWTPIVVGDVAPSTAVQAELILTGIDGAGTTVIGSSNFDYVVAYQDNAVVTGEWTSISLTTGLDDGIAAIPHGLGTNDINLSFTITGSDVGGSGWKLLSGVAIAGVADGVVFGGNPTVAVPTFFASVPGYIGIYVRNGSANTQTITVKWRAEARQS